MPKIAFQLGRQYQINLREKLRYGDIAEQRLARRFTDGRLSGLLNEELVVAHFRGLRLNENAGAAHDLFGDAGERYEVKTVTPNGLKFRPSNQYGVGRIRDDAAALERILALTGYILVDVRRMPNVTIYFVSSAALARLAEIGRYELSAAQFDQRIPDLLQWTLDDRPA